MTSVAIAGESYELTAQSDSDATLMYQWEVRGGTIEPDNAQTVVWTAPETAGELTISREAWIRVEVTRDDEVTAWHSAYVRVNVPIPKPYPEPEPAQSLSCSDPNADEILHATRPCAVSDDRKIRALWLSEGGAIAIQSGLDSDVIHPSTEMRKGDQTIPGATAVFWCIADAEGSIWHTSETEATTITVECADPEAFD